MRPHEEFKEKPLQVDLATALSWQLPAPEKIRQLCHSFMSTHFIRWKKWVNYSLSESLAGEAITDFWTLLALHVWPFISSTREPLGNAQQNHKQGAKEFSTSPSQPTATSRHFWEPLKIILFIFEALQDSWSLFYFYLCGKSRKLFIWGWRPIAMGKMQQV